MVRRVLVCRVLGPVEVEVDGAPVPLGGQIPRRLVAALTAGDGRPVTEDTLVDLLWGEAPPSDPRSSLFVYVSRLRRALGDARESVVRTDTGYLLRPDATDVGQFAETVERGRRLLADGRAAEAVPIFAEALALWRGEPFAELPGDVVTRARLAGLRAIAVEEHSAARLAAGDAPGAVGELGDAVQAEPYRERRWELLILAQYRSGRQADALASLRRVRDLLAEQLGVDPGPALQDLERRLLLQDPALLLADGPSPTARPLSAFLGRAAELDVLDRLVTAHRLVTLVGPAGVGKTRLAVEYAADHAWFIRLADTTEPATAVAAALSLHGSTPDTIAAALAGRPGLLLLDNCEHLIAPVTDLVRHLLARCPGLRILATSREPLGLAGESLLPVEPLPAGEAVALLTNRITTQRPGWQPDAGDTAHLVRIAATLDGIPLALELAAARARMLSLGDLDDLLRDHFPALGRIPHGELTSHRTLEAAVAWSVDLLPSDDRALLLRLWPFEGGFPLAAAGSQLDRLSDLVARSVVAADTDTGPTRYRLLEIIRTYCREHDPDPAASRQAHAAWTRELVARWAPELSGEHAGHAMRMLHRDLPNVHIGIEHDLTVAPETALLTASMMPWFWHRGGHVAVGVRLLQAALAAAPDAPAADRARTIGGVASLRFIGGDLAAARRCLRQARELLAEPHGEAEHVVLAQTLYYHSVVHHAMEDFVTAERSAREAITLAGRCGDQWAATAGEVALGLALTGLGRPDEARRTLHHAVAESLAHGRGWYAALGEMGLARLDLGGAATRETTLPVDPQAALAAVRRSLRLFRAEADLSNFLICLHLGAQALALDGRADTAATVLTVARGYAVRHGIDPNLVSPTLTTTVDAMMSAGNSAPDDLAARKLDELEWNDFLISAGLLDN